MLGVFRKKEGLFKANEGVTKMKGALAICLFIGLSLCMGCAKGIRYQMAAAQAQKVTVQGLEPNDKIIEVFDNYNGTISTGTWMWMVINKGKDYKIGKIDLIKGQVSDIQPLTTYNPSKPLYWTKFNENKMGGGEACVGACMSTTAFGGTVEKWGFDMEKEFWGDPDHLVAISYQYAKKESTHGSQYYSYTKTESQSGARQRFTKGETIVDIDKCIGYSDTFALKTYPRARYYPISPNIYIGCQPNMMKDTTIVDLFVYDTNSKESWGADMDFEKGNYYVDGAVTPDCSTACLIFGQPGNYSVLQYKPKEVIKAIKMFKTIQ